MKTTLLSALAFGACASVAFAESLPPAAKEHGATTSKAQAAGPVALTEAEMDQVAAAGYLKATWVGSTNAVGRHSVAAYLNTATPDVSY